MSNPTQPNSSIEHTFPSALEKETHHKDLQPSHRHHHQRLNHTKVENPTLGTAYSAEIAILARAEVLLIPGDSRELRGQFVDRFFKVGRLFGAGALARGKLGTLLVLDLYHVPHNQ